jgi:TonB family protein
MINLILTAALKGTVALGAAWIATALLRRSSADLRHRIWLAALVATALLMIPWAPPETLRIAVDTSAAGIGLAAASRRSISVLPVAFSVAWSVIAALLLLRWGAGIFRLQRITRGSRMEHGVLVSDAITTPMTWGAIRPVILLPAYVQGWPCDQRDVVIQHERAHIERRDWLWQAFAQVMSAMFWFHPLVWLAAFQMRQEAEHAADDATLATGVRAPDYADRLLAVARQLPGRSPTAAAAGVAMVRQPALTSRIAAILEAGRIRAVASAGARLGIVLAAIAVMVPLSAFQNRDVYHGGEDGVKAPSIVYKVNPSYAPEPKAAKIQGTVTITAVVNAQGRADDIRVTRSLDPQLDANAIAAVSQWLFKPGTKDDQPVDVAVTIEINFKLQ